MELAHGGKFGAARSHAAAEYTLIGPNDEVNAQGVPVKAMTEEQIKATAQAFAMDGFSDSSLPHISIRGRITGEEALRTACVFRFS